MKGSDHADEKIYYFDPYCWFFMDRDPTDQEKNAQWLPDVQEPQNQILPGEIIFWDAHYGPNEGQVPLERLLENSHFEQINVFRPEEPFQVLGGFDYEIYIFKRLGNDE